MGLRKFRVRLPVHVGSKGTSWQSGACSAKEKGVKRETDSEREKDEGRVTRDCERKRDGCCRIGKRDTVVGRFGQGCWQGEPGL